MDETFIVFKTELITKAVNFQEKYSGKYTTLSF